MQLIQTQKHHVPWRWVGLLGLIGVPYIMMFFIASGEGGLIVFSLRKFLEDPFLINAVASCDIVFNILVGATCLYLSDRVWTRFGRRKPFILLSWCSIAFCLFMIPLAQSASGIIPLVILLFAAMDVGTTADILIIETIPPHQRGRYEAVKGIYLHILIIVFALTMQGRFFESVETRHFQFRGEQAIYWIGAAFILVGACTLMLFVKETRPEILPPSPAEPGEGFGVILRPLKAMLGDRTLWPVYTLAFSLTLIQVNLGGMGPLLITEQWGYSMQDIGVNVTIGCTINICILPIIGYFADKFDRLKMFSFGVFGFMTLVIFYFCLVQFILDDHRPKIWMMVAVGMIQSISMLFVTTNFVPLTFDFIPRDMIGTAQAGINLVRSITKWITVMGVGLWVRWYSENFYYEGKTNYFSGYLYIICLGLVGCGFLANFYRKVRRGDLKRVGRVGYETPGGEIREVAP